MSIRLMHFKVQIHHLLKLISLQMATPLVNLIFSNSPSILNSTYERTQNLFYPPTRLLYFSSTPPFKVAAWFVSPLESLTATRVSLLEMNPSVSYENILRLFEGKHTCSQTHNEIYKILKSKNIIF